MAHTDQHASKHGVGEEDDVHGEIDHGSIQGLSDDDHSQYLLTDGTRQLTGDQDFGGHKATGLATPTADTDGATKGYIDSKVQGLDWQDSVLDKDLTAPPGSPSEGDRYIIGSGATGDWSGHDDEVTEYDGSSWEFFTPNEGFCCRVEDEDQNYVYNGSAWVSFGSTVDHGNLNGLADDDHTQYHNDTRGDARYYTQTLLDGGQLDNRYFTETEHIDSSAGGADSGKPIKLDADGDVDASMINSADVDHDDVQNQRTSGAYALHMKANVSLAGETPVDGDISGWADGERGIGIGTTGRVFLMYNDSGTVMSVEMS